MKKKIIAVTLSTAMVITSLSGCGKDDNSYFGEIKESANVGAGTGTTEMTFTAKDPGLSEQGMDILFNDDGEASVSIKVESTVESSMKTAAVVSAKYGKEESYTELTTMIIDEDMLYINVKPVVDFIGKFSEEMAQTATSLLATAGITGYASVNINTLTEVISSTTGESVTLNENINQEDAKTFINTVCDIFAKHLADISGKDGKDYTLTFNEDNAEKAFNCVGKLITEDSETIYDSFVDFSKVMYGDDSEEVKELINSKGKNLSSLKDVVEDVKENKDAYINLVKENKVSFGSKINVTGKEGSRKMNFSIDGSANLKELEGANEDIPYALNITQKFEEGEASITDMIPQGAVDVTVLLNSILTSGLGGPALDGEEETSGNQDDSDVKQNTSDNIYSGDYSFTLSGKKLTIPCDVETMNKAGYTIAESYKDSEIEAGDYLTITLEGKEGDIVDVYVRNDTTYKIAAEDGIVCGIDIYEGTDFKTSDGFTTASKLKDIKAKYGKPSSTYMYEKNSGTVSWNEKNSVINGLTVSIENGKISMFELVTGIKL